jgi:hypothetical protein
MVSCQPEELTACFLKAAEANTIKTLETCGLIFGALLMDPDVCFFSFFPMEAWTVIWLDH